MNKHKQNVTAEKSKGCKHFIESEVEKDLQKPSSSTFQGKQKPNDII